MICYIYILGEWDFVSIINVQFMVCVNVRVHLDLRIAFVYLHITHVFYHLNADLNEGIDLLKCLSWICHRVFVQDYVYIFNYLSCIIWDSYVFSLLNSLVMIMSICTLSYCIIKSEVSIINQCLGLGHQTMVRTGYVQFWTAATSPPKSTRHCINLPKWTHFDMHAYIMASDLRCNIQIYLRTFNQ